MNDMSQSEYFGDQAQDRESGYAGWKRAKVERGLAQAKDRAAMIPAERVLDDLKLAR